MNFVELICYKKSLAVAKLRIGIFFSMTLRTKVKKLGIVLLSIAGVFCVDRFCHRQTDGFSLYKIRSNLSFHPEWEVAPLSIDQQEHLESILNQPYSYLAKGAQSYVFTSADEKYVIKFFRIYHLRPPFWLTAVDWPPPLQFYRQTKIEQKRQELEKDFNSYKIAYEQFKEETGLVYLHLNKTEGLHPKLKLYDKIGVIHELDLDQMEFLVQKRATLSYPSIAHIAETEGLEAGKNVLTAFVDLIASRIRKGIKDKDPDLNTNFGFLGHTPIQIDVGRFRIEPDAPPLSEKMIRDEVIRITDNLNQWLRVRYPLLASHLESEIQQLAPANAI